MQLYDDPNLAMQATLRSMGRKSKRLIVLDFEVEVVKENCTLCGMP